MIPKIIHYVWVGNNPKPQFVLDCIDTWKKHLPDYRIIEWNNDSLEKMDNPYLKEAIENKKWAFASDYIRLFALYHHGGIYFDTDVEVTNSFDPLLSLAFFSGYEIYNGKCLPITSATMGASKGSDIIKGLLDDYDNVHFEIDGKLNLEPNTFKISRFFSSKFGLNPPYEGSQESYLTENAIIYPSYYFCSPEDGKINYSIHHFSGSWLPSHKRKDKIKIFNKLILSRFKKSSDKGDYPLVNNEKILLKINLSKKTSYVLIIKNK
ncbi:glycosyltransferase family 32 protein [Providencia manganoxydans]|uniref:glycosyltransferase family 32 protein n=1 Tax=Providencia manganoxydans TaxID=2923283 RepID=UPI0034E44366